MCKVATSPLSFYHLLKNAYQPAAPSGCYSSVSGPKTRSDLHVGLDSMIILVLPRFDGRIRPMKSVFTLYAFRGGPLDGVTDLRLGSVGNVPAFLAPDGSTRISTPEGRGIEHCVRIGLPRRRDAAVRACYALRSFTPASAPQGRSAEYQWLDASTAPAEERPPLTVLEVMGRRDREISWEPQTGILRVAVTAGPQANYCDTTYTFRLVSTQIGFETLGTGESDPESAANPAIPQYPTEGTDAP